MITADTINEWLSAKEDEHLDFKEANQQYDTTKLLRYCVAFANECGGKLILGVSEVTKTLREVVGTKAFPDLNEIKSKILDRLHFRVDVHEILHPKGRVLVFEVPPRPVGQPQQLEGAFYMRSGEDLVAMTSDQIHRILKEGDADWFTLTAKAGVDSDEVIRLLDTQTYFDLLQSPYPSTRDKVLERLAKDDLIKASGEKWTIYNIAAILLAKNLHDFSPSLARKAARIVIYKGTSKLQTQDDKIYSQGYVTVFNSIIEFIHSSAPQNNFIEQVVREEVKMFPKQALRELIANALVHQDFSVTGSSVMIEMYTDRIEISNPGTPPISIDRFIDESRSRNEILADLMRLLGICERKGSGIDKVVHAAEAYQLPPPDFRVGETRTVAVLFAHQDFIDMPIGDRVRACYQHCCLMHVSGRKMSNQSLKERFRLPDSASPTVSAVIRAAKDKGRIRQVESERKSTRYAQYVPFWA